MKTNRREFLERSMQGAIGASTLAVPGLASAPSKPAASDRVVVGIMGLGGRGRFLAQLFAHRADVEIAYVCDVHPDRRENGMKAVAEVTGRRPKAVSDFRTVLDDPHVDAVINATPHHWHALGAILACQAGKDVYVEKPACHSIWEGKKMVEAARKYHRVVQLGTQNRSSSYGKSARALVQSGKLGDLHLVRVFNMFPRRRFEKMPDVPTPESMKWDIWLGPAPERPFSETWFRHWLYFWDFSGGLLEDDAIHQFDLARMVIGREFPRSAVHAGGNLSFHDDVEVPDTSMVSYEYEGLDLLVEQTWWAPYMKKTPEIVRESKALFPDWYPFNGTKVEIYGTNGMMLLGRQGGGWQLFDLSGHKVAQDKQTHIEMQQAHVANFVECVRNRNRPNADIEVGFVSTAILHLANISFRVGNRKLKFDAASLSFVNDKEADRYLKRSYREPWVVPEKV